MKTFCVGALTLLILVCLSAQTATPNQIKNSKEIAVFVEQQPVFPGGDAGLLKFIQQHTKFPDEARNDSIEGKVVVRFAIDTDGAVTDVSVIKSVNHIFDSEALRVIKLLPKFKPGYTEGKPVKVYFNFPFVFRLP